MNNLPHKLYLGIFILLSIHYVNAQNSLSVSADQKEGCAPLSVSFQINGKQNIASCKWEFSNGVTSVVKRPVILFEDPGEYDVKVTVYYDDNSTETIDNEGFIQVNQKPVSDFKPDKNTACDGDPINFVNQSLFAESYLWDFGDGSNSTDKDPSHIYESGGTYTVTLVAYGKSGCSGIKVVENVITINQITGLDFSSDKNLVCSNDAGVSFTPNKDFISYKWDFGDSTFSTQKSPVHSYKNTGKHDVSLEVVNAQGCKTTTRKTEYINVVQPSELKIELSDTFICRSQKIEFFNRTKGTSEVHWTLSNNYTNVNNQFEYQFDTAGVYGLSVRVTDNNGCVQAKAYNNLIEVIQAEKPEISISETSGCTPLTVQFTNNTKDATGYYWEIGKKIFTEKSIELTFSEPGIISLISRTEHDGGCTSEIILDSAVTVNESNISSQVSVSSGCLPLETSFSLSTDKVADVQWNFGNGNTSNELSPDFTYTKAGHFNAFVSFINEYGCSDTILVEPTIHVYDTTVNYTEPEAIQLCPFEEIKFSGSVGRETWTWDFGDGNTSTEKNPLHQYTQPGTYYVDLSTQNAHGCPVAISAFHKVIVNGVTASEFEYSVSECPDSVVSFNGSTDVPATYLWEFGDGNKGSGKDIIHEYEESGYYQIKLTTTDEFGCNMIKAKTILVRKEECLDIIIDPSLDSGNVEIGEEEIPFIIQKTVEACSAPFEMAFPNPKTNAVDWYWDFKDGSTSSEMHPVHTFLQPGEYEIDLVARHSDGQIDSLMNFITVIIYDQKVDFDFTSKNLCDGTEVKFQDLSGQPVAWKWNFGDSETSIEQNPEKLYTEEGVYQVNLVSTDERGCSKRTIHNVAIGNPNHYFSFSEDICAGDTLIIEHNVGNFQQYIWDFGDGNTFTGKFPKHLYSNGGTYSLSLSAIDENGCEKKYTLPRPVNVIKPIADFEIEGDTTGCGTLEVKFKNLSQGADSWLWEFGNGVISQEKNPVIEFTEGVFSVRMTAFKGHCSHSIEKENAVLVERMDAKYSLTQESVCFPVTVQFTDESPDATEWHWSFGDGQASTEKNPVHTYYEKPGKKVSLKVTNSNGCKASISEDQPEFYQSDFEVESQSGCIPFQVDFKDNSENAQSWYWDFGDGASSTAQHPQHTYEKVGVYTVTLVTTSPTGCTDTLMREDYIKVGYLENSFSVDLPPSLCSPLIAVFDNHSVGATEYLWDFGDGSGSNLDDPVHVYSKVGHFDVQLIASNDLGCRDTVIFEKLVTTLGPEANFELSDTLLCHPQEFEITDLSASAIKWEWFFGDGNTSSEQNPVYQYDQPGSYSIALLATDNHGCQELKKFDSVKVIKTPKADFDIQSLEYCLPGIIDLINTSENLQNPTFTWDLGNDSFSREVSPQVKYDKPGSYRVTLTTTNDSTCSDSFTLDNPLNVRDTFHLKEPRVFQLTVQAENEINIKMNPYSRNNLKYNLVYKRSAHQSRYHLIDTLFSGTQPDYFDREVSTLYEDYSYIFQSHVYCRQPVPISDLTAYKSIHLEANANESGIALTWTNYHGHKFDYYEVLRKMSGGSWEEIAKLPPAKTAYFDKEDLCPTTHSYMVIARNLDGLNFHSMSNEMTAKPVKNVFLEQRVEVIRTTVVDNTSILTEWKDPVIGPDKVLYYQIWRAENENNFSMISEVPQGVNSYFDNDVSIDEKSYTYKISAVNTCDIKGKISNEGKSILLQKESDNYIQRLYWTGYKGWEEGVGEYILQKKNENGEWETIERLSPETTDHTIDLSKEE